MSSAPISATPAINLENTLGSFSITKDVSAILLGCLTVQTFLYFRNYSRDVIAVKFLVFMIWALELASYAVSSNLIYTTTVVNFGNFIGFLKSPDNLSIVLWLCAASIAFMESFYILYICDIIGRRLLTICLSLLALCITWFRCIGWLVLAIRLRRELELSVLDWLLKVELVSGMVVEVLIAGTMGWVLRKRIFGGRGSSSDGAGTEAERSRQWQWQNVEELDGPFKWVAWIVKWSLQTGALAAIVSVVNLAMNPSNANPFLYIGLVNVLSKVLSNCFLSSVNGRKTLQQGNISSNFPAYRVNSGPPDDPESAIRNQNENVETRSRDGPQDITTSNRIPNRITTALRAFIRELNLFDLASSNSPHARVNLDEEWAGRRETRGGGLDPVTQMQMVQGQQQLGQNSSTIPGPVTILATPATGLPMSITRTKNRHRDPTEPGQASTLTSTSARRPPPPPPPHLPQPQSESDLDLGDSGLEIEEVPREPGGVSTHGRASATVPSTSQLHSTRPALSSQSMSTSLQVHPSSESPSSQSGKGKAVARRGNGQKLVLANTAAGSSLSHHTRTDTLGSTLGGGRTSMDSLPSYRSRATTPAPLSPTTLRPGETGAGALGLVEKRALPLPPLPSIEQQRQQQQDYSHGEEEEGEEDAEPQEDVRELKKEEEDKDEDGEEDEEENEKGRTRM